MAQFTIRFFICNAFISGIIVILFLLKKIFRNNLSGRMQYHLWFLLLGLLAVPFLPLRPIGFPQIFSWLHGLNDSTMPNTEIAMGIAAKADVTGNTGWMNDFALSVNSKAPSLAGFILFVIWFTGMFVMLLLVIRSQLRLRALKGSALPLQNQEVRELYHRCLKEMKITKHIPIYSTAFLKSPVIVGFLKPCIYLPIHLISDYQESDMRYMLLHELSHYKHKDAISSYLMNFALVIYWFNPLIWYALKEMRTDREVACDSSVLKMLGKDFYEDYGNTLINFAEKLSQTPFPFAIALGGNMKQMRRRILNIASYEKPTLEKRLKGMAAFMLTAALLLGFAPFISTYAAEAAHYQWKTSSKTISYVDLSTYFGEYDGTFVFYDLKDDAWQVYNMDHATLRLSPNSTYKIYDALLGLEEGAITLDDSLITWDGELYAYDAWNTDQTLQTALSSSVNWYFQAIDQQLGAACVQNYFQKIGYGNENTSGSLTTYWMGSSLEISPVEQVELLTRLYHNSFGFVPENVNAVKDAILLSASENGTLYGKTGTGCIDGQDVNGWFVGYFEAIDDVYFFATNISADANAAGSNAAEITLSILADMDIRMSNIQSK